MIPPRTNARPFASATLLAALLALAGCATPSTPKKTPPALAKEIPPPAAFLATMPPPPAPGSPTMRRQIDEILALQARATPGRIAQARWTYDFSVFTYSLALDPAFAAKKYPRTAAFFAQLNHLVQFVNDDLKNHFRAPHPFQVDPRVRRFVIAVPGYDYPSYHSARCALFQRVLALLDPARADAFDAVSRQVEADRVFAGEHFPFSIEAGRRLGAQIFSALERDAGFRASVAELRRAEWTPPPSARDSFTP